MKWIVLGIVACIVPYTWLTLAYRKDGPAHQPYQDNKDRAQVLRLLDSGFYRIELSLAILGASAPPLPAAAETEKLPGGLPPLLRDVLIDPPPIPAQIPFVVAPSSLLAGAPYAFSFACAQPDNDEHAVTATLYRRGSELVVLVGYDATPGSLQTRKLEAFAHVEMPSHTLEPGLYQMTLLGARESRRWKIEVL